MATTTRPTSEAPLALSTHKHRKSAQTDVSHFDKLPDAALIAIKALAAVLSKGVSTAWRAVKNDPDFPQPIRLSAGCTRFRVGDIRAYLARKANTSALTARKPLRKGEVAK